MYTSPPYNMTSSILASSAELSRKLGIKSCGTMWSYGCSSSDPMCRCMFFKGGPSVARSIIASLEELKGYTLWLPPDLRLLPTGQSSLTYWLIVPPEELTGQLSERSFLGPDPILDSFLFDGNICDAANASERARLLYACHS